MSLDKLYMSASMIQRELGCSYTSARALAEEAERVGDTTSFDGKTLYNRAAVAQVLKTKHAKVLDFLSAMEGGRIDA